MEFLSIFCYNLSGLLFYYGHIFLFCDTSLTIVNISLDFRWWPIWGSRYAFHRSRACCAYFKWNWSDTVRVHSSDYYASVQECLAFLPQLQLLLGWWRSLFFEKTAKGKIHCFFEWNNMLKGWIDTEAMIFICRVMHHLWFLLKPIVFSALLIAGKTFWGLNSAHWQAYMLKSENRSRNSRYCQILWTKFLRVLGVKVTSRLQHRWIE